MVHNFWKFIEKNIKDKLKRPSINTMSHFGHSDIDEMSGDIRTKILQELKKHSESDICINFHDFIVSTQLFLPKYYNS